MKTKFKETEIGKIPEEWEVDKLGNRISLIKEVIDPPKCVDKKYIGLEHIGKDSLHLIGIGNSNDVQSVKFRFKEGQILFGKLRPYFRKVIMSNFDGVCSTDIFVFEAKEDNDNKFFFYFLSNPSMIEEATLSSTGTRMPRASWDYLANLKRVFPPFLEQKAIAKILSDLDSKIELNLEMNKTLEAIGQALFKRWFVNFEFPNEKGKPHKSSGGEMTDSELGEIPKGWEAKVLGELADFKNGVNYNRDTCGDSEYRIVNVRNIVFSSFITKQMLDKIRIDSKKATPYLVKKNSILIVRSASPCEIGFVMNDFDNIIYSGFIIKAELSNEKLKYYIIQLLQSKKKELLNLSDGTTLKNINQVSLNGFNLLLPSNGIIEKYNQIAHPICARIFNNKEQNEFLSNIRDSLLPRLMSGKIRVPDYNV